MADVNVRSDSVDVEQIMRQIRARVREKRGADYTEAELQQLAKVKLEKFLDPTGVRSDLLEQFRSQRTTSPAPPNFEFERGHAVRNAPRQPGRASAAAAAAAQAVLQPRQDHDRAARPVAGEHAGGAAAQAPGRTALVRAAAQPDGRDHAARHRSAEPEDAGGIAVEPRGLRRAARAVARERRAVSPGPAAADSAGAWTGRGRRAPQPQRRAEHVGSARSAARPGSDTPGGEPRRRRRRRRRRRPGQTMADGSQGDWQNRNHGAPDADGNRPDTPRRLIGFRRDGILRRPV